MPELESRTYGQRCALAKALDVVGQRWTLLIVRNLLVGPQRYGELLDGLPGVTTNLLAKRLKTMTARGLIERFDDRGTAYYRLTDLGRDLEPALMLLADWGDRITLPVEPTDRLDLRWATLSLRRRYRGGFEGVVELTVTGTTAKSYFADADGNSMTVGEGRPRRPNLRVVSSDEESLLRVLMAGQPWEPLVATGTIEIDGARATFRKFLRSVRRGD